MSNKIEIFSKFEGDPNFTLCGGINHEGVTYPLYLSHTGDALFEIPELGNVLQILEVPSQGPILVRDFASAVHHAVSASEGKYCGVLYTEAGSTYIWDTEDAATIESFEGAKRDIEICIDSTDAYEEDSRDE